MKNKFLILALVSAVLLSASNAFAFTVTIQTEREYTDKQGSARKEVSGYLTFDSDYPCNTTTGRCGEDLPPYLLGLASVQYMGIESQVVNNTAGLFMFKYHPNGLSGSGRTEGNVRAYYDRQTSTDEGRQGFTSVPTYDLSAMATVPFRAIGSI